MTPQQTLSITPADRSIDWSIEEGIPWLVVQPERGKGSDGAARVQVKAFGGQLNAGTYLGKIAVKAPEAANTPIEVPITFKIK